MRVFTLILAVLFATVCHAQPDKLRLMGVGVPGPVAAEHAREFNSLILNDTTAASACVGTSTLNGTTAVTIATTCIETGDLVFLTRTSDPTLAVPGSMWATNIVTGVSFDIDADNATDDSTVNWFIVKAQ